MSSVADRLSEFMTPARRRALWAVGLAAGVHVVILLMFAAVIPLFPDTRDYAPPDRPPDLQIEEPTPTPPATEEEKKKPLDYIATNPNQKTDKPPEKPDFQSSDDTAAATDKDGEEGKPPLPTTDGADVPFFAFDTKRNTEGEKAADLASPNTVPQAGPTPVPDFVPPQRAVPDTAPPKPQPNLTATPAPPTPRPTAGPRELAMLAPQPTPPPTPPPDAAQRPPQLASDLFRRPTPAPRTAAPPSVASPGTQQIPGYQPETQPNRSVGGLSNRGAPSVSAIGTPLGRYQKAVQDAIGMKWYFYANRRSDLSTVGTVKVHFYVNAAGRVEGLRLIANSSNETVAGFSLQSIQEAKLPPMPAEVSSLLPGGRLEYDFSFALY